MHFSMFYTRDCQTIIRIGNWDFPFRYICISCERVMHLKLGMHFSFAMAAKRVDLAVIRLEREMPRVPERFARVARCNV